MELTLTVGHWLVDYLHNNLSAIGEFDRVSGQIDQNLAQPHRIAHQMIGDACRNICNELQTFLIGADAKRFEHPPNAIAQTEISRLELQFSGFDFRKVENVVDQAE